MIHHRAMILLRETIHHHGMIRHREMIHQRVPSRRRVSHHARPRRSLIGPSTTRPQKATKEHISH
jgi:hypothetical protein